MSRSGIPGRREFLLQTAAVLGSWAVPQSFRRLLAAPVRSVVAGGVRPAPDETTGLPLLMLPEGFRYLSFGWTGDMMSDGMGWSDIQPGWEMVVRQQPGARHYFRHHRRLAGARDLVRRAAGRQPSESPAKDSWTYADERSATLMNAHSGLVVRNTEG